jgi:hypothetical protein
MLRGADNAPPCSCQAARSFNANQLVWQLSPPAHIYANNVSSKDKI